MLNALLSPTIQAYLHAHEDVDIESFLLKHQTLFELPASVLANQLAGRQKAKEKLPEFYATNGIVYPPVVNMEQCSSEQTANFKASILKSAGKTLADLTGGFGVDTYYFSKFFDCVYYIEPESSLVEIAKHNHTILGAQNIFHRQLTAEEFLETSTHPVDCIYVDPSRRKTGNQKVYSFADSQPNVIALQEKLFEKASTLLIKASPLLDVQQGIQELKNVERVFIVSVANECKELLFWCSNDFEKEPLMEAINVEKTGDISSFSFYRSAEQVQKIQHTNPLTYLYEPNASILKSGAFKLVGSRLLLQKISANTHLYTSDVLIKNFPGRVFKIEAHVKANPNEVLKFFPDGKANITTRNYPLSVEELRKKTKLKNGGEKFLIGFSGVSEKFLAVAQKV